MSVKSYPEERLEFIRIQYQLLFARNENAQNSRWIFLQWSLVGILAFYGALFSETTDLIKSSMIQVVVWFPVPVSCLGLGFAWGLRRGMVERGLVMRAIENQFEFEGWETARAAANEKKYIKSPLALLAYFSWWLLIVCTVGIASAANSGWLLSGKAP